MNIVLINPEIPQNTGNIGRTCVGLGATLHIVGPPGFSLDDRLVRRAGLDYWPKLKLERHSTWSTFQKSLPPSAKIYFFSTKGERVLYDVVFEEPAYLIFGSESRGFPRSFYVDHAKDLIRIPVSAEIRSLNLATAAGVVAYEVFRQTKGTRP